jgi:origin recognition complex subunit 3
MEHQRCYIYEPPKAEERAQKRQRTNKYNPHAQLPERLQTYRDIWSQQEERIKVRQRLEESWYFCPIL